MFSLFQQCDKKWCWQNESGLPKPDLVLYLRMSPQKAALRNDYGNELYEKLDFQEKVSQEYKEMMDSTWKVHYNSSFLFTTDFFFQCERK